MVTRPSIKSQRYTQKKSKKLKTIEEEQKKNKNIDLGSNHYYRLIRF